MITKDFNMMKPADVREILKGDQKVVMMLGLTYKINGLASKIGYIIKRIKDDGNNVPPESRQMWIEECEKLQGVRKALTKKLSEYCKLMDVLPVHQMGSRIKGFQRRVPVRGQPRPPGKISNISQASLFVFSDLFDDEVMSGVVINTLMMKDMP